MTRGEYSFTCPPLILVQCSFWEELIEEPRDLPIRRDDNIEGKLARRVGSSLRIKPCVTPSVTPSVNS